MVDRITRNRTDTLAWLDDHGSFVEDATLENLAGYVPSTPSPAEPVSSTHAAVRCDWVLSYKGCELTMGHDGPHVSGRHAWSSSGDRFFPAPAPPSPDARVGELERKLAEATKRADDADTAWQNCDRERMELRGELTSTQRVCDERRGRAKQAEQELADYQAKVSVEIHELSQGKYKAEQERDRALQNIEYLGDLAHGQTPVLHDIKGTGQTMDAIRALRQERDVATQVADVAEAERDRARSDLAERTGERDAEKARADGLERRAEEACKKLYNIGATRGDVLTRAETALDIYRSALDDEVEKDEKIESLESRLRQHEAFVAAQKGRADEWAHKAIDAANEGERLQELLEKHEAFVEAWDRFVAVSGDAKYNPDMHAARAAIGGQGETL